MLALCVLAALPYSVSAQLPSQVRIEVRSGGTGLPVQAALVLAPSSGLSVVTNDGGRALLRGLAPGTHTLVVSALGYHDGSIDVEAINGRTVQLSLELAPDPLVLEGVRVGVRRSLVAGGVELLVDSLGPTVTDVATALDRVAGVTVVRQGGPGSPAMIQLRGAGADQVLVLLDGVTLNSPLSGEVDLSTVDLESLESIVVLPGAQSARYGARALGGVVVLTSGRADSNRLETSLRLGGWGSRAIGANTAWTPSDQWTFGGGGAWSRSSGDFVYDVPVFRGGGETNRLNADHRSISGHASGEWRSARRSFSMRVHATDIDRGSPGTIAQPSRTGAQTHRRVGSSLSGELGDSERGVRVLGAWERHEARYHDPTPPFGEAFDSDTEVDRRELDAEAWWERGSFMLRVGGQLHRYGAESSSLDVSDSDRVTVTELGVWNRLEFRQSLSSTTLGGAQASARLDQHDLVDGSRFSPSLSAFLERGRTRLTASVGRAFSPPGLSDLFFQEGVLARANPDLRPERVDLDASVSLSQSVALGTASFDAQVTAYHADIEDMILWFPDFRFIWSPDNYDVRRRGVEVAGSVTVPLFGRSHTLAARTAWSDVEYRGEVLDGQVAYRPERTSDIGAQVDLAWGALTVDAAWIGERRSIAGSPLNALDGYETVDIGLALPFALNAVSGQLHLTLTNAFDRRAALLVDYPLPGRGWSARLRLTPASN